MENKDFDKMVAELTLAINGAIEKAESVIDFCKSNEDSTAKETSNMEFALSCMKSAMMVVSNFDYKMG